MISRRSCLLKPSGMIRHWSFDLRSIPSDCRLWHHASLTAITTWRSTAQALHFRADSPCAWQYGRPLLQSGPNVATNPQFKIQTLSLMFTISGRQIFLRRLRGAFVMRTYSLTTSTFSWHQASFPLSNRWWWWTSKVWYDWISSVEKAVLLLCTPCRTLYLNLYSKGSTSGPSWTITKVGTYGRKWKSTTN